MITPLVISAALCAICFALVGWTTPMCVALGLALAFVALPLAGRPAPPA